MQHMSTIVGKFSFHIARWFVKVDWSSMHFPPTSTPQHYEYAVSLWISSPYISLSSLFYANSGDFTCKTICGCVKREYLVHLNWPFWNWNFRGIFIVRVLRLYSRQISKIMMCVWVSHEQILRNYLKFVHWKI